MCDTAEHHAVSIPRPDFTSNVSLVAQHNPINPSNSFGFYGDLSASGNLVAIGTQQGTGVAIVSIANPSAPTFQSYYNPADGGKFKDVIIRNNVGYFALDNNGSGSTKGIHIVNLTNPQSPTLIAKISGADSFQHNHNIFLDGRYLFAAPNDQPRVRVYDVLNPAAPVLVREFSTTGTGSQNLHDLTVRNGKLYTSNTDNGVTDVYDVTNVASPAWTASANRIASFNVGPRNHSNDVTADGRFIVCCRETENGDCQVWSLVAPGTPVKVATINKDTIGVDAYTPHNPVIVGDKLYISWYQAGVQVFDFSNPANPVHKGGFDTFPGGASVPGQYLDAYGGNWGVYPFLGADKVLLSDMERGLFVVDARAAVPEPASLVLLLPLVATRRGRRGRTRQSGLWLASRRAPT
jgi:hypothetical protein